MTKAAPTASILEPQIIFEDNHLIVLVKPPGLLSQGDPSGDPNLVDWLRVYLGRNYVGLIHRLDRNTSGIMVVAKRTKAAQRLTDALQKGELTRSYLGWAVGRLEKPTRWEHQLLKNEATNTVRVVQKGGKVSALSAVPVSTRSYAGYPCTLIQFSLETGRSHQIRVQSAHEGLPLLGDVKYSQRGKGMPPFHRVALHSYELAFPHPMTHELLKFQAPLPEDLQLGESTL